MSNNLHYSKLKALIKSKGLSMVFLAEKLGMTYQGLRSSVISGVLPMKKWQKISEILETDMVDVINLAEEPTTFVLLLRVGLHCFKNGHWVGF